MSGSMVRDNLARVQERITDACRRAGRAEHEVTLVCVSKTFPAEAVREVIEAGVSDLGENYIQEAEAKIGVLGHKIRWHMIGHVQRNKAAKATALFDMVQTIDSPQIAERLSKSAVQGNRCLDVLVEVNVAEEACKTGVTPSTALNLAALVAGMPNLCLRGIMGIPPFAENADSVRPYFRILREIWERLPEENRTTLSMGMSGDFETAIEEGSTMIRVGTAIFGHRD